MNTFLKERVKLGRTDLYTGRLGLGSSYTFSSKAIEEAFEAGCNFFYWGAIRTPFMAKAIRRIIRRGRREDIIIAVQAFIRPRGIEWSLNRGLRKLGIDFADVFLLGLFNKKPHPRILEKAQELRHKELFRYLGISSHNRKLLAQLGRDPLFDILMVRYNAAHRGAEQDVFPYLPQKEPGIIGFTATDRMKLSRSRKIPKGEKPPSAGDCYRFVLSNSSIDITVTSPWTRTQMRDNLKETNKGPLSRKEMEWMRRIGDAVYGQ
ncbi:aldo/keto reductase [bacterium]|nr:aldo/keto reductase [bacterium]